LALEYHLATEARELRRQQIHHRQCRQALAAARLTDDADGLAGLQCEGDVIDQQQLGSRHRRNSQAFDTQQFGHVSAVLILSMASFTAILACSPSPSIGFSVTSLACASSSPRITA